MRTKKYQRWNYTENLLEVEDDIKNLDYLQYIIIQPQEYYYDDEITFTRLNKLLNDRNKFLTIYIGSEFNQYFSKKYNRINFIQWDSIDYFSKSVHFYTYINSTTDEVNRFYEYLKDFPPKKHFTSLVNIKSGRFWRIFIINQLYKNDLIKYGNFSFRFNTDELNIYNDSIEESNIYFNYSFNDCINNNCDIINFKNDYWLPKNETFDDLKSIEDQSYVEFIFKPNNGFYSGGYEADHSLLLANNISDLGYMTCAFDIVFETIYDYFFVTEKTLRPIDAKKPFIVFSGKNYHKKLKEKYGFKLFDNIIDYSFDDEDCTTIRWQKMIQELIKLKTYFSPDNIKILTKDAVIHNYNILLNIRNENICKKISNEYITYNNKNHYYYKCNKYNTII